VPPVLSLPGAVRLMDSRWRTAFDTSLQAPRCLRKSAFIFTDPGAISKAHLSSSQSSGWGSSGLLPPLSASYCRSSLFAGPDRTPKSNVTWNGSALLDNPRAPQSCARSPARLPTGIQPTLVSRTFSSQFLLGPPARLVCLSRDPAVCFWSAHFPCPCPPSPHPWFEVRLRM